MVNGTIGSFPILKTERLTLRQLEIDDEQQIFNLRSDKEINKYLDRPVSNSIDDARSFIERITQSDALYWAITLTHENILIGTIGLFSFSKDNTECEIGFELLTRYQGQGIMKEALTKVIDYALNTIKVKRIEAFLHKANERSRKLLEKCSFRNTNEPETANPDLIGYHLTI